MSRHKTYAFYNDDGEIVRKVSCNPSDIKSNGRERLQRMEVPEGVDVRCKKVVDGKFVACPPRMLQRRPLAERIGTERMRLLLSVQSKYPEVFDLLVGMGKCTLKEQDLEELAEFNRRL